ncbi:MAG: hypothetical protein WB679_26935 [Terracidiphilus sp.]
MRWSRASLSMAPQLGEGENQISKARTEKCGEGDGQQDAGQGEECIHGESGEGGVDPSGEVACEAAMAEPRLSFVTW